ACGVGCTWRHVAKGQNDLNRRGSNREALLMGAIFGVLAMLLHSVVDFNLQIPSNAILFVTLLAILSSFRRYEPRSFSHSASWFSRVGVSLLLTAGIVYLGTQGLKRFEEQQWLRKAEKVRHDPLEHLQALKNAYQAEPQNFLTTYRIGEVLRTMSWQGDAKYREQAHEAMEWFRRGMELNRYLPYNYVRYGMCLDWVGEHDKARAFYDKALQVDPNNYFVASHMGWHYMQVEDYVNAKKWFERSWELYNNHMNRNPMPGVYLEIIHRRLHEVDQEPVLDFPPEPTQAE
ncbi:MAG: tetratricopeptide repeat protein, partial [Limisphaerales bacterium]